MSSFHSQRAKIVTPREMRAALTEWFRAHTAPVPIGADIVELRKWSKKDRIRRDRIDVKLWAIATEIATGRRGRRK